MSLLHIAILGTSGLFFATVMPPGWRRIGLFTFSLFALYGLQPRLSIRWADFVLPTVALWLVATSWHVTRSRGIGYTRDDMLAACALLIVPVVITTARIVEWPLDLVSRPPPIIWTGVALAGTAWLTWAIGVMLPIKRLHRMWIIVILILFVSTKWPGLTTGLAAALRGLAGQDMSLATAVDIRWLGFSYLVLRLLHTTFDAMNRRLPDTTLMDYTIYMLFPPALAAGPIDRLDRFIHDLNQVARPRLLDAATLMRASSRITIGLAKKFIIADSLAIISLSPSLAAATDNTLGLWLMLYAFGLQLYFDFSGYSDVAIGLGLLFAIRLPENFHLPYFSPNLTAFWQRWHITLGTWARTYIYFPSSRAMLRSSLPHSMRRSALLPTAATMIAIGLWHGISGPFLLWGAWHTVGLWLHRLWRQRSGLRQLQTNRPLYGAVGVILTVQFVMLGWVWFVFTDVAEAVHFMQRLFSI